jgi:hypothetical protein
MAPEVALEMLGGVDRVAGDQDVPGVWERDEQCLQPTRVAWCDDRADAAEQLLVTVEEPVVEFRSVKELVGDVGFRESLLVVLKLDDDFSVGEEEVAATVVGMQVGVDDMGDVGDLETDLGESTLEPVLGLHPRQDLVGVLEAEAVIGIVDVRDASRYRRGRFRRCRCG